MCTCVEASFPTSRRRRNPWLFRNLAWVFHNFLIWEYCTTLLSRNITQQTLLSSMSISVVVRVLECIVDTYIYIYRIEWIPNAFSSACCSPPGAHRGLLFARSMDIGPLPSDSLGGSLHRWRRCASRGTLKPLLGTRRSSSSRRGKRVPPSLSRGKTHAPLPRTGVPN